MADKDILQRVAEGEDVGPEATELFGHYVNQSFYWLERAEMSERAIGSLGYHAKVAGGCFYKVLQLMAKHDADACAEAGRIYLASHEAMSRTMQELDDERAALDAKYGRKEEGN